MAWDIILTHMRERRRAQKDATLCQSPGESSETVSADDSSSNNGASPPTLLNKKRKEYVSYFNPGKHCQSCYFCFSFVLQFTSFVQRKIFFDLDILS